MKPKKLLIATLLASISGISSASELLNNNQIDNGDFSQGDSNWRTLVYKQEAQAEFDIGGYYEDGRVRITDGGTAAWNIQLIQGNLQIEKGKAYRLQFDYTTSSRSADGDIEVVVEKDGGNYEQYMATKHLEANPGLSHFDQTFTMTKESDFNARIAFNFGNNIASAQLSASIWVDNVILEEVIQTGTLELREFPIQQLEVGQSIDTFNGYTLIGSTFGKGQIRGAGMLFEGSKFIRNYHLADHGASGTGSRRTMAIGSTALAVSAPYYQVNGTSVGAVGVANKTWNGTHYQPNFSQILLEGSKDTGTAFGSSVALSNNWLVVGAPLKGTDGGAKLFFRSHSNGKWEARGWLPTPDFSNAPYRINRYGTVDPAKFGNAVDIKNQVLVVAAGGIGSFYAYRLVNQKWTLIGEYQGEERMGDDVAITEEFVISSSYNKVAVYKVKGRSLEPFQEIEADQTGIQDIDIDGHRLVVGQQNAGADGAGEVRYYELKVHQVHESNLWTNGFIQVGRMLVDPEASLLGLQSYRLLGRSVAIHGSTVVAGAPNSYYTGPADGAGFQGSFYDFDPIK